MAAFRSRAQPRARYFTHVRNRRMGTVSQQHNELRCRARGSDQSSHSQTRHGAQARKTKRARRVSCATAGRLPGRPVSGAWGLGRGALRMRKLASALRAFRAAIQLRRREGMGGGWGIFGCPRMLISWLERADASREPRLRESSDCRRSMIRGTRRIQSRPPTRGGGRGGMAQTNTITSSQTIEITSAAPMTYSRARACSETYSQPSTCSSKACASSSSFCFSEMPPEGTSPSARFASC